MKIELSNIWHKYHESKDWVLKGVNAEFVSGKIIAVVGPNGSGKTTLLKIASLLYKPSRGEVVIGEIPYWSSNKKSSLNVKKTIVYVHEIPILVRGDALYNVAYGLLLRGVPEYKAKSEALKVMESIGIRSLVGRGRKELSAGEAQLVSIARAITLKPKLLFLDEPTAHLDVKKRATIERLLRKLKNENIGCVVATHDYLFASAIADDFLLLERGRIIATGKPKDLLEELMEKH